MAESRIWRSGHYHLYPHDHLSPRLLCGKEARAACDEDLYKLLTSKVLSPEEKACLLLQICDRRVSVTGEDGWTSKEKLGIVLKSMEFLLDNMGDAVRSCRDLEGKPPLYLCIEKEMPVELAECLLNRGVELHELFIDAQHDGLTFSCLSMAVFRKHQATITLLLRHKADPQIPDGIGFILLSKSWTYCLDYEIMRELLMNGMKPLQMQPIPNDPDLERHTDGLIAQTDQTLSGTSFKSAAREEFDLLMCQFFVGHGQCDRVDGYTGFRSKYLTHMQMVELLFEHCAPSPSVPELQFAINHGAFLCILELCKLCIRYKRVLVWPPGTVTPSDEVNYKRNVTTIYRGVPGVLDHLHLLRSLMRRSGKFIQNKSDMYRFIQAFLPGPMAVTPLAILAADAVRNSLVTVSPRSVPDPRHHDLLLHLPYRVKSVIFLWDVYDQIEHHIARLLGQCSCRAGGVLIADHPID